MTTRIAAVSDIHDHIHNLRTVLERVGPADLLLCPGDLCAPFMVDELADGFDGPIHLVFGNNDGDAHRITRAAAGRDRVTLHGEFCRLPSEETGGVRVAMHHFPEVGRSVAEGDRYDLVVFGHSHEWEIGRSGETLYVNPGEVMGRLGPVTAALVEPVEGRVDRIEVRGGPA